MAPQVVAASNQTLAIETSQLMVQTGLKTQWKIADKKWTNLFLEEFVSDSFK